MGAFLGPLGGLVEFVHWRENQFRTTARPVNFKTTLGGSRKAFLGARPLREWAMSATDMSPERAAQFELLLAGAYGPGPWRVVDPMAQVANVVTPRKSVPGAGNEFAYSGGSATNANISGIGRVPAVLGAAGTEVRLAMSTPVLPGVDITASAWINGSASGTIRAQFLDAAGGWTTSNTKTVTYASGWTRVSVLGKPGDGTAVCDIRFTSTSQFAVALPAVTWTPQLMPWGIGRGCDAAIITDYGDTTTRAGSGLGGSRLADYSFTVTEVGDGA